MKQLSIDLRSKISSANARAANGRTDRSRTCDALIKSQVLYRALSPSIIDDIIFASCFDDGVFNLFAVNQRLHDNGAKIIPSI